MAKPRKSYKKRPLWHYFMFYVAVGVTIYGVLSYTGFFNSEEQSNYNQPSETQETEYFE